MRLEREKKKKSGQQLSRSVNVDITFIGILCVCDGNVQGSAKAQSC